MKVTSNVPPTERPPALITIEMTEADARLLLAILGGSHYGGNDFKPLYEKSYTKFSAVWDGSIGQRLYDGLKPVIQGL
jgi:hypothetical protein